MPNLWGILSVSAGVVAVLSFATPAAPQDIRTEQVRFAGGTSGTVIQDSIRGDQIVDYVLRAESGQTMSVEMTTGNPSSYFNVTAPGASAAMHIGSTAGNSFRTAIPSSGDYRIRVYLMRNAARRDEHADYRIDVSITGGDSVAAGAGGPEAACRNEVARVTNASRVEVVDSDFSEAGTMVRLAVGPEGAPWQCIAYRDGSTAGVQFLGDDSAGTAAETQPDYADGLAGGPDFWRVVDAGSLNIRSGPSTGDSIVKRVSQGTVLRNLGCGRYGDSTWCQVALPEDGSVRGWASSRYLAESGAPESGDAGQAAQLPAQAPESQPDHADGLAGGPDFWQVVGVAADDTLNIRRGPSARDAIVISVANRTVLRNLGCRRSGNSTWCEVAMPHNGAVRGWANSRYLAESGALGASGRGHAESGVPEIYVRPTGEAEVGWSGGCTVLYDASGYRINAGSSCSRDQLARSDDAIRRYRREQGL